MPCRGSCPWLCRWWALPSALLAGLAVVVSLMVGLVAPRDAGMGDAQRIVYVHVSVAWVSLLSFVIMAVAGIAYLRNRELRWDAWSHAAAEIGWLCCSLTLLSGSMWARTAWGTWWTWDPRLTTSLILWAVYTGCLSMRGAMTDAHRRARICAVLAALGLLDVPMVAMATRWFRGIHPVSPEMDVPMRLVLLFTAACFTVFFAVLLVFRQNQLRERCDLADPIRPSAKANLSVPARVT